MLSLGQNPNCLSSRRPQEFISVMSLEAGFFPRTSLLCQVGYRVYKRMKALDLCPVWAGKSCECVSTLLDSVAIDDSIRHFGEKGYRFPGKNSPNPIQHAIRTWSLPCFELSNDFGDPIGNVRRGWLASARANNCLVSLTRSISICNGGTSTGWNWDSRLSARASAFSKSKLVKSTGNCKGSLGSGILVTSFVIFNKEWSSGFRDSSVSDHWAFLHSLSSKQIHLYVLFCWKSIRPFFCENLVD